MKMKQIRKILFSLNFVLTIIILSIIIKCGFWTVQELEEYSAPLLETKIIKPWTSGGGHETPILTNKEKAMWQSSTPPTAAYSRSSFLRKNVGEVVLHYDSYQNLTGGTLTYYGKTIGGNIVFYEEL